MEVIPPHQENDQGHRDHLCLWFTTELRKVKASIFEFMGKMKKLAQDDPRRTVHSFKVGLALIVVSLFYYFQPLYNGIGVNAIWAVLTVVVVFEFSVGATLGKGLNRMLATLVAGALGVGAHALATLSGKTGEPILVATFVFIIAATITFARFCPALKARYDYGLMIFILTFCMVSVSGYREDELLKMARERLSTIAVGSLTAIIVCVCVWPVWLGQDLHDLVAANLDKLGNFLEGFGDEFFQVSESENIATHNDKSVFQEYKSVLTSKNTEETMANLARWEPRHGQFSFRHPWKQYLKVGALSRSCAYKMESLNSYLSSDIQSSLQFKTKIQDPIIKICTATGKALKELASATKKMKKSKSADIHIANSKAAAEELKILLKTISLEDANLLEIIPVAAVAFLLMDVVECTEQIAEAVYELASLAHFKSLNVEVQPLSRVDVPQHVITVTE